MASKCIALNGIAYSIDLSTNGTIWAFILLRDTDVQVVKPVSSIIFLFRGWMRAPCYYSGAQPYPMQGKVPHTTKRHIAL